MRVERVVEVDAAQDGEDVGLQKGDTDLETRERDDKGKRGPTAENAQRHHEAEIDTTDGLRVQWPFGWGLVRASNTAAQLTLRFEADSRAHLEDIRERFRAALARLDPGPEISF